MLRRSGGIKNLRPQCLVSCFKCRGIYATGRLENPLNCLVCRGRLMLASARRQIAVDWTAAYRRCLGSVLDTRQPHTGW